MSKQLSGVTPDNLQAARLWSTTQLVVWPVDYFVISFAPNHFQTVMAFVATLCDPFLAVVFEPDEVSLTISQTDWRHAPIQGIERDAAGPFKVLTLKQNVGLDVYGYLAPLLVRFAEAQIPIIPQAAYLKEHWIFQRKDFTRAIAIVEEYIVEQKRLLTQSEAS